MSHSEKDESGPAVNVAAEGAHVFMELSTADGRCLSVTLTPDRAKEIAESLLNAAESALEDSSSASALDSLFDRPAASGVKTSLICPLCGEDVDAEIWLAGTCPICGAVYDWAMRLGEAVPFWQPG